MTLEENTLKFLIELRDHHGYDNVPIVDELIDAWELNISTLGLVKRWLNTPNTGIDELAQILNTKINLIWESQFIQNSQTNTFLYYFKVHLGMARRVEHIKYECPDCGEVDGVMWWSNDENEMLINCRECGKFLQVYDQQMYHTAITEERV